MAYSEIIESLNPEQKRAVEALDGPVLINAGAGSGKTRVLTSRIALLLENGIAAERILALTFTKKAADEMKKRVALMTKMDTSKLVMGTFHSVFIKFLRQYATSMGYPEMFTIYDEEDSESCLKESLKAVIWGEDWEDARKNADEKDPRFALEKKYKLRYLKSRISLAKNNMYNAEGYANDQEALEEDTRKGFPLTSKIFLTYSRKCRLAGAMDFDDILLNTEILLARNAAAFQQFSNQFDYILVDEYQDTNFVQYSILRRLTAHNKNICVVGDDSQSIYGFRGAKIDNILNFHKDYPGYKEFRLVTNYRSTSQIVDSANRLISHNANRLPKECISNAGSGFDIQYKTLDTDKAEASYVAGVIRNQIANGGCRYDDFAIIYRTNVQSRLFEEAFIRMRIPYTVYSGVSFFQRAEVKDTMAYFKLSVNPNDDEAFKRAVSRPKRGLGTTSLNDFVSFASTQGMSLYGTVKSPAFAMAPLKPKAKDALVKFVEYVDLISWDVLCDNAAVIGTEIIENSGLLGYYKEEDEKKGDSRCDNIREILSMLDSFCEDKNKEGDKRNYLSDFLDDISLLSNNDLADTSSAGRKVALMTAHCSKGLEFPYVFVVGSEEGLFPYTPEGFLAPSAEEEERRLFYVAITRAEKNLFVTNCKSRLRFAKWENNKESRFLKEMRLK